jgi:hypothetical protein
MGVEGDPRAGVALSFSVAPLIPRHEAPKAEYACSRPGDDQFRCWTRDFILDNSRFSFIINWLG